MPKNEPNEPNPAHADVGIVCAFRMELAPFLAHCDRIRKISGGAFVFRGGIFEGIRVAIVESGTGFASARRATHTLIDAHTPPWIVSAGFSGALLPQMHVGDIAMADAICDTHGQELNIDLHAENAPTKGLHTGKFLTTDRIIRTVHEKEELAARYAAIAVDMESLAVAQVCRESQTRFLAVRVISDDMSADLPPEIHAVFAANGYRRLGAATGAIWHRPGNVRELWRLWDQAQMAAQRLAGFLDGVLPQLYETRH